MILRMILRGRGHIKWGEGEGEVVGEVNIINNISIEYKYI